MKYRNIFLMSAATLLLVACSQNTDPKPDSTVDNEILKSWKDQTVQIVLDEDGCVKELKLKESAKDNNCSEASKSNVSPMAVLLQNCGQDQECVCTIKSKHVSWEVSDNTSEFEILFDYGKPSPFTHNCKLSSKNGTLKCKVEEANMEEIQYSVKLVNSQCPKYDPRIVVRHQNSLE